MWSGIRWCKELSKHTKTSHFNQSLFHIFGKTLRSHDLVKRIVQRAQVRVYLALAKVLKGIDGIAFCTLTSKDVVRHPLVQKIVQAYDDYEAKEERSRQRPLDPSALHSPEPHRDSSPLPERPHIPV